MGISIFSKSSYDSDISINPDPNNYRILRHEQIGKFLIVMIQYPSCSTYEGVKILVYQDTVFSDLLLQKQIDPHFSDNQQYRSPIARFVPLAIGWEMAQKLCKLLHTGE